MSSKSDKQIISSFLRKSYEEACYVSSKPEKVECEGDIPVAEMTVGSPIAQPSTPSSFSLYKLQNTAEEISKFTASNLNMLYAQQKMNFAVDEAIFLDFKFAGTSLVGKFKIYFTSSENEFGTKSQVESQACVYWNGETLSV